MKQYLPAWVHFKDKRKTLDVLHIHWSLAMILAAMSGYCKKHKLPLVATSIIRSHSENQALGAVSKTHVEGRAVDLSVKGWETSDIEMFVKFWNGHHYNKDYGAISSLTKQPNLVVYHNSGHGDHLHIPVRRE
jgi:hypothetical protein